MENNSIINSLKRLERVGAETSRVTMKLKEAVTQIADKIFTDTWSHVSYSEEYYYAKITGKLYADNAGVYYDYDGELRIDNFKQYHLNSSEHWVCRECALEFAKAISEGLLEKVADWVENKKLEAEKALKAIEATKENL